MQAWWVDSLEHVFRNAQPAEAREWLVEAARNEVVSLQFVVRSEALRHGVLLSCRWVEGGGSDIPTPFLRPVGYVPVKKNTPQTPPEELAGPAPGWFPDPLLELGSLNLEPGRAQPVWVTLRVPADATPDRYRGLVRVEDGDDRAELTFDLVVHAATLPEARTLQVTNWFWADDRATRFYGVDTLYSEPWWRMVEGFLENQWAHRQNVFWLRPYEWAVEYSAPAGQLRMDFSRFDRWVAALRRFGGPFSLEGPFLTLRDGYDATFEVPVPVVTGRGVDVRRLRCDDPRVEPFLRQFLREYWRRIEAHGLQGKVFVHVGDEPHGAQMEDYARLAGYVHRHAPGLPVIEALDVARDYEFFDEHTDIWVPLLGRYDAHLDVIEKRRAAGKPVWHYTCLFPRGRHPNRFVDYPLLKTRLLHWLNYRLGLGGYLHWGWNAWIPSDPFSDLEPEWGGGTTLPAGDAFLVYPGRPGVLDSIRYEQMLEGIQDYELLRALEAKRPEAARDIAAEVVASTTGYVRRPARFRELRRRLLEEGSRE